MDALGAPAIDLWCSFVDAVPDDALLDCGLLLSEEERRQEQRFYFARDRRRYRVTRALVRTVLSKYATICPRDWRFAANAYGKPEIANDQGGAGRVAFNVTHAGGLIVVAVVADAPRRALGVDTERLRPWDAPLDAAAAFLASDELAALSRLPADRQPQRFFEYWTLKESYIKARGHGLSIPLDRFAFHLHDDRGVTLWVDPAQDDSPQRWRFWQFRIGRDHVAAVCTERAGAGVPPLTLTRIVPLVSESPMRCTPVRSSDGFTSAASSSASCAPARCGR